MTKSFIKKVTTTQKKKTPRTHQFEAILSVVKGFEKTDRGQLIMACGTGKTLTSLWIKEKLKSGRTLILFPSLSLISQSLKEWQAESNQDLNWICVCSDKTVAREKDAWVDNASDLGIPVTNDVETIAEFLVKTPDGVIFSTYQSSSLVAKAQKKKSKIHNFELKINVFFIKHK